MPELLFKPKKCIVLGSTSFAGAWFVAEALDRDLEVIGMSRSQEPNDIFLPYKTRKNYGSFKFEQLDINNDIEKILQRIAEEKPDVIVDFAAQSMVAPSWQYPEHWYQTNIVAKAKLHNALRAMPFVKRYIRISTPEVYGSTDGGLLEESIFFKPSTPYAVSQAATDMSLLAYYREYNLPMILTRFANFYGSCQQLYRIVPKAIYCALTGETLQLHGGGASTRAFIHAKDVADGVFRTMMYGQLGETYHFSTEEFVTIKELVEMIAEKAGVALDSFVKVAADRPGKDAFYLLGSKKAMRELEWKPQIDLAAGIDDTYRWVRDNLETIKSLPKDYIHKP